MAKEREEMEQMQERESKSAHVTNEKTALIHNGFPYCVKHPTIFFLKECESLYQLDEFGHKEEKTQLKVI